MNLPNTEEKTKEAETKIVFGHLKDRLKCITHLTGGKNWDTKISDKSNQNYDMRKYNLRRLTQG